MSTYMTLLKPMLIAALLILSLDESQAASLSDLSGPTGTAKPEMTITDSDVRQTDSVLAGGDSTFKGRTKTVVHPKLKPDYACQNLHVREPTCPSR
jgi:hypothetical protein